MWVLGKSPPVSPPVKFPPVAFLPVNYSQVTSPNILSNIKQEKINSVTVSLYYRQIKSKGCLYGRTNLGRERNILFQNRNIPFSCLAIKFSLQEKKTEDKKN